MSESTGGPLARIRRAKRETGRESPITGLKLVLVGIQLTLIGGFVPGMSGFILAGGLVSVLGLLVR